MSIRRRRLTTIAGALLLLSIIGAGLAQAAPTSAATMSAPSMASATTAEQAENADGPGGPLGDRLRALRERFADGRLGRLRQHLVHGTFTVVGRDGKLVTVQLDHGTVSAIEGDSIAIAEAGGSSVTILTNADTKVRKDHKTATLAALEVGDEVVVHSIVEGGSATARLIVVPPPAPTPSGDAS